METLRDYLNKRSVAEQEAFARSAGTTVGYLRKALSTGQSLGAEIAIDLEINSDGEVRCEDLRPDIDWNALRARRGKAS